MEGFIVADNVIFRLVLAALLGFVLGIEREVKRKQLGLKTILVISIVSCLLTVVSIESVYRFPDASDIMLRMDPLRLAAQIVSGVGFLGAGVILRKDDDRISGLTTAALVWGAAGIGITTGAGFYFEAVTGVVLLILGVELLPWLITKLPFKSLNTKEFTLKIKVKDTEFMKDIIKEIESLTYQVKKVRIKELKEDGPVLYMSVLMSEQVKTIEFYEEVTCIKHIGQVDVYD